MNRRSSSGEVFQRLREKAEAILQDKGRETPDLERDDLMRLTHELEIYYIELELQNQELLHAKAEIEESRNEYSDLYESAPVAYLTLNEKGFIERANKAALLLLKGPEGFALGSSFLSRIHVEDISLYSSLIKQIAFDQLSGPFELRLRSGNGEMIHVQATATGKTEEKDGGKQYRLALVDITERKRMEEELRRARDELTTQVDERTRQLQEKEVLLKEIHHRVKNNMQVISSLLALQADELQDGAIRAVLQDVTHRVRSMAMVHEKLYQSADLAQIDFAEYARSLLSYLWRAHGCAASGIRLALDLEPVSLSVDAAVPCGLILNELATNALKHAFGGRADGVVTLSLRGAAEGQVSLCVRDNGVGLPDGFDWRQARTLGLRLVQMLTGQLQAALEVSNLEGTEFKVTFGGARK